MIKRARGVLLIIRVEDKKMSLEVKRLSRRYISEISKKMIGIVC